MMDVASPPELILSKLYPPRPARHQIARGQLLAHLSAGADRALTLVCAPAGSGKSNLLSEWLRSVAIPSGWLSLDHRDDAFEVFLGYLLAAVEQAIPAVDLDTKKFVAARVPPPVDVIARTLSNDLDRHAADLLLVLDDYHVIENPRIHEFLLLLLEHPPANLHLVVATRSDPPWPLSTLRARGLVAELRFRELQFTAPESEALLRTALGAHLPQNIITTLHQETEGWAAGLQLMTLVLRGQDLTHPNLTHLPRVDEDIGAYLLAEVFSKQSPLVQQRLLQMSILERFSASLCEAVCDQHEAQTTADHADGWGKDLLADLIRANLFIVRLDARHEYYRFHHLFQQFLYERLTERATLEEIARLHRRASGWYADRELIEEAIDHALTANDTAAAARLVARHRHELYNHEQFARLARWLRLLPAEVKEWDPELLLAEARVATLHWRYTEAAVFLERAGRLLDARSPDDPGRDALLGELAVLRGILEFWEGDVERFVASAHYALQVLPPDASHLRGHAHTGIASGLFLQGGIAASFPYLEAQLASYSPSLPVYAWLLQTKAFQLWEDGNLADLHDTAQRLLGVSVDLDLADHVAMAHYFLGIVHYARNKLDAAERHLTRVTSARYTMRLMWWCQAVGVLGLTYQALDQPDRARDVLEDAHAFLLELHAVRILPDIGAFQAEVNRLQGRIAEAGAWAAGVDPLPINSIAVLEPRLVQARVFLSQDDARSADQTAQLLSQLRANTEQIPDRRLLMDVEASEALLFARQGDEDRALATLQRVVLDAEKDGWVRLFVDCGPEMQRLLRELAVRGVAPHYVDHLLAAFPSTQSKSEPRGLGPRRQLVEPLSEREVEVLRLLSQRYSNKEIAEQLFIAPATVKYHTLNIYRKLDAADRREAVARAADFGLVPTS